MDHFAGLDVSVKETSVCIVDETGSAEAGSLDSGDMYKHIFSAGLRLNKAVPFLGIEPLHSARCHFQSPLWNISRCPYVLGVRSAPGGSRTIDLHQGGLS